MNDTPKCDALDELAICYCDEKCVKEWKRLAYKLEADNAALRAALEDVTLWAETIEVVHAHPFMTNAAIVQARAALAKETA